MELTSAADTPLGRRFAAVLAETEPGRIRISRDVYTAAFLAAEPSLAMAPERRARLAAALDELVEAGVLVASRTVDRSEWPPLPRFVVLVDRTADPPVGPEATGYPWRPELAWAARLPLRRSEFDALRAIQAFLRDRGASAPVVPIAERSLELFGDEKRLDALRRNRRLFAPKRLSLELLRSRLYAPPFVFRRVGDGPVALVLENVATYRSVLATLPPGCPVGLVVFGAGGNFAASVGYFAELTDEGVRPSITQIRYFGDLDRRGLEIPIVADVAARDAGLPAVRPAVGLWAKLLRDGRRGPHPAVEPDVADRLAMWLPASLRSAAREVLISAARLAQEAVGTESLAADPTWATWAGLGPPGVKRVSDPEPGLRRPSVALVRKAAVPAGESALVVDDTGQRHEPALDTEWATWVAAADTRNWVLADPVLDWLQLYGKDAGLLRDDERPSYDPRIDFQRFVLEKGAAFEVAVMRLMEERTSVVRIAECREDARSLSKARATLEALRAGVPVVVHAVLRNPARQTYGVVDLLVRSDLLASWFPELLSREDAVVGAPGFGHMGFHYRPIEVKFHTFELTEDGHVGGSAEQLAYAVQAWLYADALGRLQGYVPPSAYLLGRTWQHGEVRGEGCFERLARVDVDRWLSNRETTLEELARDAVGWIRRLRAHGATWRLLPEPSVPELYPHARNAEDSPWHAAKRELAEAIGEVTLLPAMNPQRRAVAHAAGIRRWNDDGVSAARLGITSPAQAARADAVLAANRAPIPTVVPERIRADPAWREVPAAEFYVDFEMVSNLDDDLVQLPRIGGQAQIVQVGCGHVGRDDAWHFVQWTVDALTIAEERRILHAWITHMIATCAAAGVALPDTRLCHWSPAEPVNFETAYQAARMRHRDAAWPAELPWFDVLERVIRTEPVAVTGAFNFGLKSIAKAMHGAGLIAAVWADDAIDGLGAMVGTWLAARQAVATGTPLSAHPLMVKIASYNEVDCRAMSEIIGWLREHR